MFLEKLAQVLSKLMKWCTQVVHLAQGCISDAGMTEALQACRQATKIRDMLPALQQVNYRLSSGQGLDKHQHLLKCWISPTILTSCHCLGLQHVITLYALQGKQLWHDSLLVV